VLTCTDKREVGTSTETVEDKISDLAGVNVSDAEERDAEE
jgi:hypothetical protein